MPTYEYACAKCGHTFDVVQSMSAKALEICPQEHCPQKRWGKGKVKRAIGGGAGLIFKGSGFYSTDYRSEGYKSAAKQDSSAGDSKPATSDAKPAATDSKPAATNSKPAASDSKPAAADSKSAAKPASKPVKKD